MSALDPTTTSPIVAPGSASEHRWRLRQIFRSATFLVGLVIVLFWVFCAIFGPLVVPYDPYADDLLNALLPPSAEHWFGTDQLGRDVFSRVIVGARDIRRVDHLKWIAGGHGAILPLRPQCRPPKMSGDGQRTT